MLYSQGCLEGCLSSSLDSGSTDLYKVTSMGYHAGDSIRWRGMMTRRGSGAQCGQRHFLCGVPSDALMLVKATKVTVLISQVPPPPNLGSTIWDPCLHKAIPSGTVDGSGVFGGRSQVERWPWGMWEEESPACW